MGLRVGPALYRWASLGWPMKLLMCNRGWCTLQTLYSTQHSLRKSALPKMRSTNIYDATYVSLWALCAWGNTGVFNSWLYKNNAGILTVHSTQKISFPFYSLPSGKRGKFHEESKFSKNDPITVKKVSLDMCVMDIFTGCRRLYVDPIQSCVLNITLAVLIQVRSIGST